MAVVGESIGRGEKGPAQKTTATGWREGAETEERAKAVKELR